MVHDAVKANPDLLPRGWQHDTEYAAEVYARVDRMLNQGYSSREIARRVGCSDRLIHRFQSRGRVPKRPSPNLKLHAEKVRAIRRTVEESGLSYSKVGAQFGVPGNVVGKIVRRESWAHVD